MIRSRIQLWWQGIIIPPRQRPGYFVIYLILCVGGAWTLLFPATTSAIVIGSLLTFWSSLLLVIGGSMGAVLVLTHWWAMERAAIVFNVSGLAIYFVMNVQAQFSMSGSRGMPIMLALALIVVQCKRLWQIRRWSIAPPTSDD